MDITKKSSNLSLNKASKVKNDEFYTQLEDVENELKHYKDQFKGKVVYCNCDDPFESNFFKFFASNFKAWGLKRLIATSYKPSPIANTQLGLWGDDKTLEPAKGRPKTNANKFIINEVGDLDNDGAFDLQDIAEQLKANKNNEWSPMESDGDFRSLESIELLKQADIVVTNPPFSLFREYIAQLVEYEKKFLIIGNKNAITYKEIFPLIKNDKLWIGYTSANKFFLPDGSITKKVQGLTRWFTNLDIQKRHEELITYKKYNTLEYYKYDNYDAIEVAKVNEIPGDYNQVMGVPVTFLDKYNPEQFEIIGATESEGKGFSNGLWKGGISQPTVNNKRLYKRIFIKNKKPQK